MAPLPGPAAAPQPPRLLLLPAATATAPCALGSGTRSSSASPPPPRKRQRLAHLSVEEKALRRKLKNRVAAQSARDRKKARMGELERQAVELEAENQKLLAENQALRQRTLSLARENRQLRLRLGLPATETPPPQDGGGEEEEGEEGEEEVGELGLGPATGSAESAALRLRVPLQQGQAQQSPLWAASAWMLAALALLPPSLISSWAFWTAWTQTCFCSMETWSQLTWRKCSRKSMVEKWIPYQPLLLPLWGPPHPSWKPLTNSSVLTMSIPSLSSWRLHQRRSARLTC